MYSAVEVADFVVDRHLHHGCVVEQCILVKRGQDVVKSRTVVILSWEGYFWRFMVSFNDVFNEIHLFIFFLATWVNICSQPVRETCNQFGMALQILSL